LAVHYSIVTTGWCIHRQGSFKIFQGWLALYGLHGDDLDREQLLAPLELSASQLLL
jgi:hypothetical protein